MKLPELSENCKAWDHYRKFHWNFDRGVLIPSASYLQAYPVTAFDTGEVIVCGVATGSDSRCAFPPLNIEVCSTTDSACPTLVMPDGTDIPKTWLNEGGMQDVLIDYDLGRAYGLSGQYMVNHQDKIPRFLHQRHELMTDDEPSPWVKCVAYYPGPGTEPVAAPIELRPPMNNKKYVTPEERERVAVMGDLCRAVLSLGGKPPNKPWRQYVSVNRLLEVSDWTELYTHEQAALFHNQIARKRINVPWLKIV